MLDRLADLAIASLRSQVEHGARAVQLFDSWAGALSPQHYERFVLPASSKVFAALADLDVPRIHFGVDTGELLGAVRARRAPMSWASTGEPRCRRRGRAPAADCALQGNLDPAVCFAPWDVVAAEVRAVLADNDGHPGHIFNLGHGVLPDTDPSILERVVDLVHREGIVRET